MVGWMAAISQKGTYESLLMFPLVWQTTRFLVAAQWAVGTGLYMACSPSLPPTSLKDAWGRDAGSSRAHAHAMCVLLSRDWFPRDRSRGVLVVLVHMESTTRQGSPPQGRTLNSWFAVVVGSSIVEPRSLSMFGIDTLARAHTHTHLGRPTPAPSRRRTGALNA